MSVCQESRPGPELGQAGREGRAEARFLAASDATTQRRDRPAHAHAKHARARARKTTDLPERKWTARFRRARDSDRAPPDRARGRAGSGPSDGRVHVPGDAAAVQLLMYGPKKL